VPRRGIEIPGRNGQTSQGLDLGLSESCFGRARRRGLVARRSPTSLQERSVRRPCAEAPQFPIQFVCGPATIGANSSGFEALGSNRHAQIACGVLRSKYQVGDCLVIFSATLESKPSSAANSGLLVCITFEPLPQKRCSFDRFTSESCR